ncbi:MAG: gene transfer agent family protein [Pseudomonadota bacterium]
MKGNPARGEVSLRIDGQVYRLRLTLGALAALEARLETGGLVALAERFESGRVGATEVAAVLAAGLSGAGEALDEDAVMAAEIEGGAAGALQAALTLLARSFGSL